MQKPYKSSPSRLAKHFESSRDKWKARADKYQTEKRSLQTRVRDLERSASNWKEKYFALKNELKADEKKI